MKIISWNCNMAFRKKAKFILGHSPDILVIPECESPERLKFPEGLLVPDDMVCCGENEHKGLGVFSFGQHRFRVNATIPVSKISCR